MNAPTDQTVLIWVNNIDSWKSHLFKTKRAMSAIGP